LLLPRDDPGSGSTAIPIREVADIGVVV